MEKIVYCVSVLEIVLSLIFLIYGAASYLGLDESIEYGEYKTNLKVDQNGFLGPLIIVVGLIGMIVGVSGYKAVKNKGLWACIYVLLSLVIALVCLIIGGVILGGDTAAAFKEKVCDRVYSGEKGSDVGAS